MLRLNVLAAALLLAGCATTPKPSVPEPLALPEIEMPPREINGAIYQAGYDVRLYDDRIARRVGDLVTVVFEESTNARKGVSSNISKDTSIDMGVPVVFGRPMTVGGNPLSASVGARRDFEGQAAADQSNLFKGVLTATVIAVHPNGNLVIQGQKKLTLNRGDEYVTITGVIRREDLNPDNTISSQRVANAQISYTGTGELADASRMGWLSRIFNSVIWPF
ncbi:MAG: flagellar basal body L-ring protein FlgH [Xanthomonadaceae bacterium]|nr:flagellar basal body L-ring protein FlgH [Xanthomonadaceae bacterium]